MSLKNTLSIRLKKLIRTRYRGNFDISNNPKLGSFFNNIRIKGTFLTRLNQSEEGFGKILKDKPIKREEISTETKFNDLVDLIIKNSGLDTIDEYENIIIKYFQTSIVKYIKSIAGINDVLSSEDINTYLNNDEKEELKSTINEKLTPYLLRPTRIQLYAGTIKDITKNIVQRNAVIYR